MRVLDLAALAEQRSASSTSSADPHALGSRNTRVEVSSRIADVFAEHRDKIERSTGWSSSGDASADMVLPCRWAVEQAVTPRP